MLRQLVLCCLVLLPGCRGQNEGEPLGEVYLSIDISQSRAQVGDEVTMVCRTVNMPSDGFIYWFKTVMAGGEELIDQVALSSQPLPPYDLIPRMSFDSVTSGDKHIFTLKIQGVTEEDSGHYGCSYREMSDNIYETEIFEVYSGVDNITVSVNGSTAGEDGLFVVAGEPVGLEVWAGHSVPAPVIYVDVDGTDVTQELSYATSTHVRCGGSAAVTNCPLHFVRSAKAFGPYTFDGSQDGGMMTVKVKVVGSGFGYVNKTLPLVVNHSPIIKCSWQQYARRQQNYTIVCFIDARPAADLFYWRLTKDGQETFAFPGIFVEGWNATAFVKDEGLNQCALALTIHHVVDYHYVTYDLVVGNVLGNNTSNVTLYEDFSPTVGPSGAAFWKPELLTILLTIFLIFLGQ